MPNRPSAGQLNRRVTFQRRGDTTDPFDGSVIPGGGDWEDVYTCAARLQPKFGGDVETFAASRLSSKQPVTTPKRQKRLTDEIRNRDEPLVRKWMVRGHAQKQFLVPNTAEFQTGSFWRRPKPAVQRTGRHGVFDVNRAVLSNVNLETWKFPMKAREETRQKVRTEGWRRREPHHAAERLRIANRSVDDVIDRRKRQSSGSRDLRSDWSRDDDARRALEERDAQGLLDQCHLYGKRRLRDMAVFRRFSEVPQIVESDDVLELAKGRTIGHSTDSDALSVELQQSIGAMEQNTPSLCCQ